MYLATEKHGLWKAPDRKPLTALFCKHNEVVEGEGCSKAGARRISGRDYYAICARCGSILNGWHDSCGG